jgi:hypothetical protein
VLQPVQRALPSQRLAIAAQHRLQLPRQHRKGRVLVKLVVIVEIFVAQRQTENPLTHQRLDAMLDKPRTAPVREALGKAPRQTQAMVHLT